MSISYDDLQSGSAAGFWIRFVLSVLATWRVSHLLVSEDGPWDVIARLRLRLGDSAIGRVMDCFGCTSLWAAAPISLFVMRQLPELVVCWLALSGAAYLLELMHPAPLDIEPIAGTEQEEPSDGMLR
jgi:Protein of unknown function (DUF1360)